MSSNGDSKTTATSMVDLQAAFLARDKEAFDAMLAKLSPKDREGVVAVLRYRHDPKRIREKLVAMGYTPDRIGPLPYLPGGSKEA